MKNLVKVAALLLLVASPAFAAPQKAFLCKVEVGALDVDSQVETKEVKDATGIILLDDSGKGFVLRQVTYPALYYTVSVDKQGVQVEAYNAESKTSSRFWGDIQIGKSFTLEMSGNGTFEGMTFDRMFLTCESKVVE